MRAVDRPTGGGWHTRYGRSGRGDVGNVRDDLGRAVLVRGSFFLRTDNIRPYTSFGSHRPVAVRNSPCVSESLNENALRPS